MQVHTIRSDTQVIEALSEAILRNLRAGKRVLWLVPGGSAIGVAVEASRALMGSGIELSTLSVALTDERLVASTHPDSNAKQLRDAGFDLPLAQATQDYATELADLFAHADYKIGLFGMGPDGHIAALFPRHAALGETARFAISLYDAPKPPPARVTMTPRAIAALDEAVLYAKGPEKKAMLEQLKRDAEPVDQPAQLLKRVPAFSLYTDQDI
jgi:6-phosphogluconolactonase